MAVFGSIKLFFVVYLSLAYFLNQVHSNGLENDDLPLLYDYYTGDGINEGLNPNQSTVFKLNGRDIMIYSGELHYFRVPQAYWKDRLSKMRAAGLNSVTTYVPWNLHEPQPGIYDFGHGPTDFSSLLNLENFLQLAKEADLFVIVRPGPYICAEWEFGGFPSWLLNEPKITLRSSDPAYMKHVQRYFGYLLPILAKHQFQKGGSIIAVQVENEYASRSNPDKVYLEALVTMMRENGIVELLVTSDAAGYGVVGSVPEAFKTVNFAGDAKYNFDTLLSFQPNRPVMSMEHYAGWFDHWTEHHWEDDSDGLYNTYESILTYPGSVSLYMFFGGTDFGFLNGANFDGSTRMQPSTTSYDYDGPLNEAGDYKNKYKMICELLQKYNPVKTYIPDPPQQITHLKYPSTNVTHRLSFEKILELVPKFQYENVVNMEALPINNNTGQQYGYINYRKTGLTIKPNSILRIEGRVCDTVVVLINNKLVSKPLEHIKDLNDFGYWRLKNGTLNLGSLNVQNATLDLLVQNWGRVNYGTMTLENTKKGLWQGNVLINDEILRNWTVYPLEFRTNWINSLDGWEEVDFDKDVPIGPALYKAEFISSNLDTFINTTTWNTGFMAVNGFNLGRYTLLGPQRYLYTPASLFSSSNKNEIVIFENFAPHNLVEFSDSQIYITSDSTNKDRPSRKLGQH